MLTFWRKGFWNRSWRKGKSVVIALLLLLMVLAPARLAPLAESTLSPLAQALPSEVVYENSALINVYKLGPAVSQSTPLLSKLAAPDNSPYAKWDRATMTPVIAPVISTGGLQTAAFMSLKNDRPLLIRENDPSHSHLSRILAVKLDGSQRQHEFLTLTPNFVTAVNTLTCLTDPAEKALPANREAVKSEADVKGAHGAPGWLSDIRSAWQANLSAVTNLNVIKARGAATLADPRNDALVGAGNGMMLPANASYRAGGFVSGAAPSEFSWDGKTLRLISDCSSTGGRWTDS